MSIERFHENAHMSKIVVHAGVVHMSGQVAEDPSADFEGQLRQILDKIDQQLAQMGIGRDRLLSATIWIDDYRKWERLNAVWDAWVPQGHKPARSCVQAQLAFPQYQVEIQVTAAQ